MKLKTHNIFIRCCLYDKQFENDSDLNDNYKILSYFNKDVQIFTKLNFAMRGDGETTNHLVSL